MYTRTILLMKNWHKIWYWLTFPFSLRGFVYFHIFPIALIHFAPLSIRYWTRESVLKSEISFRLLTSIPPGIWIRLKCFNFVRPAPVHYACDVPRFIFEHIESPKNTKRSSDKPKRVRNWVSLVFCAGRISWASLAHRSHDVYSIIRDNF